MKIKAVIFLFFLGQFLSAQGLIITIVDDETSTPMIGASIQAFYNDETLGGIADIEGRFVIEELGGLISIKVSYLGYNTFEKQIELDDDRALEIRLTINESNIAVNPIIIANPFISSDVSFNRKEFQVLPGAYEDPSRLLLKAPGFTTANDQANSILYKGFPSNMINWNVNGNQIVNPNHLSNAGTLSDVSSSSAGGVNMISGQVIGKYDFQSAPFDLPGNNAIAGNSDLTFSNYNNSYLNLSLVGLEAGFGLDGERLPGAQFNYRYSTVGILTGVLGLDFGGEEIVYQDLFSKFDIIQKEDEKLSAFLVLGINHNYLNMVEERDSVKTFKDAQDIDYDSQLLLSGLNYEKKLRNYKVKAALNFSSKSDTRSASALIRPFNSYTELSQKILSSSVDISNNHLFYGAKFHYIDDAREDRRSLPSGETGQNLRFKNGNLLPYVGYMMEGSRYYFKGGSGLSINTLTNNFILEPHLKFIGKVSKHVEAELAFRRNSQLLSASNFSYIHEAKEILGNHYEVYLRYKASQFQIYLNGFAHQMTNILQETNSLYSQFNGVDHPLIGDYDYDGVANSRGFSAGLNTSSWLIDYLSLNVNATFFKTSFKSDSDSDGFRNTFDFGNTYNFLASYIRPLQKDKEFVISVSSHLRGGLYEYALDEARSQERLEAVYDFSQKPEQSLSKYSRIDFRFVYNLRKGGHRKYAKSFSLDIQNIANRENDAFTNIDFLTGEPFVQKQLGLIPILAYRIEF